MELSQILFELENYTGKFPRLALERAIEEQEAITPILLETLTKSAQDLEDLSAKPDYMLHIYALFLLAQFREVKAYPVIVEFFSTPGDISLDTTGDIVTEDLGNILASVYDGNIEPIKQLIENPEVNEFVRGAALKSLVILVIQNLINREEIINYFAQLLKQQNESENSYFRDALVTESIRLCPVELKEDIDQLFEKNLVDLFFVNQEDVEYYLNMGLEATLKEVQEQHDYKLIENVINEMEWWVCFQEEKSSQRVKKPFFVEDFFSSQKVKSQKKKKNQMQKKSRRQNRAKKK